MTRLAKAIRSHREISRSRREIYRAIEQASTPTMRDELIMLSQRQHSMMR